ncbi:MAG: sigma-54 interaction domain-containing protein [Nitrospirales bacterium]
MLPVSRHAAVVGNGPQPDRQAWEDHLREEAALLKALTRGLNGPIWDEQSRAAWRQRVEERLALVQAWLAESPPPVSSRDASTPKFDAGPGGPEGAESLHKAVRQRVGLIGDSPAMQAVYRAICQVCRSRATTLLRGKSGTGKELVARAIHLLGDRPRGPFVPVHCGALPETLLESELFGHERGAFTGAVRTRRGRFEQADGGTLFLDEIGDIPLSVQVKLLRVLQDRCLERVGGNRSLTVDVRLLSATHRDLEAMVRAGTFREDQYYRLNVIPIHLPPLRDRLEDIPQLIEHVLAQATGNNRRSIRLGPDLTALLRRYHWPGNVRELQNCVERLVVMAESDLVTLDSIPGSLRGYIADIRQVTDLEPSSEAASRQGEDLQSLGANVQDLERRKLRVALERTGWVQARAARLLGITPRQVAYKIRKYRLVSPTP